MKSITLKTDHVHLALQDNRTKHLNEYEASLHGYHKAAIQAVKALLDKVKDDVHAQLWVRVGKDETKPESHEKDYDLVLEMLSMHDSEHIEISQGDFRRYIKDEWDWSKQHHGHSQVYAR